MLCMRGSGMSARNAIIGILRESEREFVPSAEFSDLALTENCIAIIIPTVLVEYLILC